MKKIIYLIFLLLGNIPGAILMAGNPNEKNNYPASQSSIYHIGKCNFIISDLKGGAFSSDSESGGYTALKSKDNTVFSMTCQKKSDIPDQLDAKNVEGKWISFNSGKPFSSNEHFLSKNIAGKNWYGLTTAYDQITGPDSSRQRIFLFCISETNGDQALCGQGMGLGTSSPATTKTIQSILDVVKSIEFVDSTGDNKP